MDAPDATLDLDADPDVVWDALTDSEGVDGWLGAGSHLAPTEGSDLLVADTETATTRRGVVEHVEPHRRLVYTWWPDDDDGSSATTVDIRLRPLHPGTRVTVVERPAAPDAVLMDSHARAGVASGLVHWDWRLAAVELTVARRHPVVASTRLR